jgi:surface antigen
LVLKRTVLAAMLAVATLLTATPATPAAAVSPDSTAAELATAKAKLADLNDRVDRAGAALDQITRKLTADQSREADLNHKIADLARLQYEHPAPTILQLLAMRSLSDVLAEISQQRLIDTKKKRLLDETRAIRRQDQAARDDAAKQLALIKAARDEAARVAAAAQAAHQAALAAQAAALAAAQPPVVVGGPVLGASGGNHFTFGYCTWYVANKRYIPWFGNAAQWWPNARPYGYPEGQTPQVGAVMVTMESGYGHVAYVEKVNADGSWVVSEMNFVAWDVVDTRTIKPGQVPLIGFIYNK